MAIVGEDKRPRCDRVRRWERSVRNDLDVYACRIHLFETDRGETRKLLTEVREERKALSVPALSQMDNVGRHLPLT